MSNLNGSAPIVPDAIWQGKGKGHRYQLRIVGPHPAGDGRVVCERTAMPSAGAWEIGCEITVTADQLRSAYEPTGNYAPPPDDLEI